MLESVPTSQQSYRTWMTWLRGMLLPSLFSVLLFVLLIFWYLLPAYRQGLLERKKESIRSLTQTVVSILKEHHRLVVEGHLAESEAQSRALEQVRGIRFGLDLKDYFWISDAQAHMVMHPYRPDLEGKNLSTYEDAKGKYLFVEFVKTTEAHEEGGYIDYHWQWQDDPNRIVAKLSYVQRFAPWGWIVGTGIYLEDVHAEIRQLSRTLAFSATAILVVISGLVGMVVVRSGISEKHHQQAEREIRKLNAELEERVQHRTAELQAANEELEAFAYSVSHDLRAPLRSINGFSHALLEDHAQELASQGRDYLERVNNASQHMSDLIDDILALSRMTCVEITYEDVRLDILAQTIRADLEHADPQRRVTWSIASDLVVQGDTQLLQRVMQNLLENAWKFTAQQDPAEITVGHTQQDGQAVFFVRDNGVGFDMAYSDKLFGVFQRLHRVEDFPGHGIGLASVQRIVRRHGGHIWAESAPGQGATFYFTLALQPAALVT